MSDVKQMLDILRSYGNFDAVVSAIEIEYNKQFPKRIEAGLKPAVRSTRNARVIREFKRGSNINDLAGKFGMSSRQIRNILAS